MKAQKREEALYLRQKREEALYLRINELENKIKDLTADKEKTKDFIVEMNNELSDKINEIVCTVNTLIDHCY